MWELKLYDSYQNELKEGDLVEIYSGSGSYFYSEVKFLEDENAFAPMHTFCFLKIKRIDKLPENIKRVNEDRYLCWYSTSEDGETNDKMEQLYLDWKVCESRMNERSYRIFKIKHGQQKLF